MKPIVIKMKDLSESTEIYDKKPNPAIVGFVYIMLAIVVITLVWMSFSEIDIVAEAGGVVNYTEDVAEVKCEYNARVVKCNVEDGQYVKEGDVLYELKALKIDKESKDEELLSGHPVIRAKENGYFYSSGEAEVGSVLQMESRVGFIFPKQEKTFNAQIYVNANEIGKIEEGQEVTIEISAYPASEYGTITATIRKIGKEAEWDLQTQTSYFQVWAEFNASTLVGKNNKEVSLVSGLFCSVKIVTDHKRVISYVWEAIR